MAVILGVIGGVFWSAIYNKLGHIKSVFLTRDFFSSFTVSLTRWDTQVRLPHSHSV